MYTYHGNCICGHGCQLLIFESILSKAEKMMMVFTTKLAIQIQLKVLFVKVSGKPAASYSIPTWCQNHKYWIAVRHYAHYRSTTNNQLTFFQKVEVLCDGKQSFEPCPNVLFGVLLFCLNTNIFHTQSAIQSAKVTCSWSAQPLNGIWKLHFWCLTYSLQATELIHRNMTMI